MQLKTATTILVADLIGPFLFAIEGALAAMDGGTVCFVLRLAAVSQGWHLPKTLHG